MTRRVLPLRVALLPLLLGCACAALSQTPVPSLRETRVTASRFSDPAQSLPMGVSVITADEIRAMTVAATIVGGVIEYCGDPEVCAPSED